MVWFDLRRIQICAWCWSLHLLLSTRLYFMSLVGRVKKINSSGNRGYRTTSSIGFQKKADFDWFDIGETDDKDDHLWNEDWIVYGKGWSWKVKFIIIVQPCIAQKYYVGFVFVKKCACELGWYSWFSIRWFKRPLMNVRSHWTSTSIPAISWQIQDRWSGLVVRTGQSVLVCFIWRLRETRTHMWKSD